MAWQLNNTMTPTAPSLGVGQPGGSLQLEGMNHLAANSTLMEAEELIRHWLAGVESAASTSHRGEREEAIRTGPVSGEMMNVEKEDFLSSVDWISGDVGQSTKDVLRGLLSKELECEASHQRTAEKRSFDPLMTMEMRHKQVRQRREHREKKRREVAERKRRTELAQREARALVMEEERRAKAREAEEERMIQQQMKALRREMREREKFTRQLALEQSLIAEEPSTASEEGAAVMEAEKFIKSERQRVATRMELVRQLEEVEVKETKENIKLLHQCFQSWWGQVMRGRGKLAKAVAIRDWRLVLRVWKAWRRFVRESKERKVRDQLARWLQREKRLMDVAVHHHTSRILRKSLGAWHKTTRQAQAERRQEKQKLVHREKMAALLQAATAKAAKKQRVIEDQSIAPVVSPTQQNNSALQDNTQYTSSRQLPSPHHEMQPIDTVTPIRQNNTTKLRNSVQQSEELSKKENHVHQKRESPKKPPSSNESSGPLWKKARKQLDELLSQVEAPPTTTPTAPVGVTAINLLKSTKSQSYRTKPKPVTKHLAMTAGMERRSAQIAERRLAREQRREAKLKERAEELAREEEEQRRAEAALKEARLKQKKEERQLAKQRELERSERQRLLTEKMTKASSQYHTAQLRWRGMAPWRRFVAEMKACYLKADQLRERALTREVWSRWRTTMQEREKEREAIASAHYHKALLRRSLSAWVELWWLGCELEALAEHHRPRLLLQRVFRGWAHVTREERREEWEKMARARRFRQRQVQCSVLRAWHGYVPAAREERERERRREQLRRKVASWLTDYKPSQHSTVTTCNVAEQ